MEDHTHLQNHTLLSKSISFPLINDCSNESCISNVDQKCIDTLTFHTKTQSSTILPTLENSPFPTTDLKLSYLAKLMDSTMPYQTWLKLLMDEMQLTTTSKTTENRDESKMQGENMCNKSIEGDSEPVDLSVSKDLDERLLPNYDGSKDYAVDLSQDQEFRKRYHSRIQQAQDRILQRLKSNSSKLDEESSQMPTKRQKPKEFGFTGSSSLKNESMTNYAKGACRLNAFIDHDEIQAYRERRRRNNEAAKRSRDARKAKEDEIALHAAFLEQENARLKLELSKMKQESAKLKCMLYNS